MNPSQFTQLLKKTEDNTFNNLILFASDWVMEELHNGLLYYCINSCSKNIAFQYSIVRDKIAVFIMFFSLISHYM